MSTDVTLDALTPLHAIMGAWAAWVLSWFVASVWSRRTVARPGWIGAVAHYIPTVFGALLLFSRQSDYDTSTLGLMERRLWHVGAPLGWLLFALAVASFTFTWWARLWLGSLWSSTVTRKTGHRVVDTGPYRLVRHPIYTGLIAAGFFTALEIGTMLALIGAAVMSLGWWMKARVEERFLTQELGPDYADYRRRTAMLVPFLKLPG
ncbi:MAG: methyltransferase family protein [Caulobacterales bacterium]